MIKALFRVFVTTAYGLRDYWSFHRGSANNRYKGVYGSYDAALAALPRRSLGGFNHSSVAEFFADTHFVFNPSDYPVLFWLSRVLEPDQMLFDFGGGVGQCFYIYQRFLRFPVGMRWRVCDLEALTRCGERLARERNATGIWFTNDFDDAGAATVLLSAGTLHYVKEDLSELLGRLSTPPKHVLINRVPMYEGETYYTVQNSEHSFVPNKVMNLDGFVRGMEKLNYEKIDQWYLPRIVRIPFHPERFVGSFSGFYFRQKDDS